MYNQVGLIVNPNTIKTSQTTSPKTQYFPTLTFENVFSMLAIRAIGSEIGLKYDGGNTYDGFPTHPKRYFIVRSLNLLKTGSSTLSTQWA